MAEGRFNIKKDGSLNLTLKLSNTNLTLLKYIVKKIKKTIRIINDNKGFIQININSKKDIKKIIKLIDKNKKEKKLISLKYTEWKEKKKNN